MDSNSFGRQHVPQDDFVSAAELAATWESIDAETFVELMLNKCTAYTYDSGCLEEIGITKVRDLVVSEKGHLSESGCAAVFFNKCSALNLLGDLGYHAKVQVFRHTEIGPVQRGLYFVEKYVGLAERDLIILVDSGCPVYRDSDHIGDFELMPKRGEAHNFVSGYTWSMVLSGEHPPLAQLWYDLECAERILANGGYSAKATYDDGEGSGMNRKYRTEYEDEVEQLRLKLDEKMRMLKEKEEKIELIKKRSDSMNRRERCTLLLMISALLSELGIDPGVAGSAAEVQKILERHNVDRCEKTIRDKLRAILDC